MDTKKVKLQKPNEWGSALHTALRKCCDSTATTIAYNAVSLLHPGWEHYLKHLEASDLKEATSVNDMTEKLRIASLKWDYLAAPRQDVELCIILHCAFKLFSVTDWQGFSEYLSYE